jgi:hypothetical protein
VTGAVLSRGAPALDQETQPTRLLLSTRLSHTGGGLRPHQLLSGGMPPLSASGARVLREVEAHRKQQQQQQHQTAQVQSQRRVARPRPSGGQGGGGSGGAVLSNFGAPDNVTAFLTPLSLAVAVRGPSTSGTTTSPVTTRRRAADTAMQLATSALAALGEHSGGDLDVLQRWGSDGAAADAHATAASVGGAMRNHHADGDNASSPPRHHVTPEATGGSFSPRRLLAGMLSSPRGRGSGGGMASSLSVEQQHALLTEVATLRAALAHAHAQLADVHAAHASALAALTVLGASPGDAAAALQAQQAPAGSIAQGSRASLAAPATSRLRSLLLWTDPGRSARVLGGCAYILLCIRWGKNALSLTGVAAAMHAALVFLALSFIRQRLGRLMGWAPRQQAAQSSSVGPRVLHGLSPHDAALVAQEQAIRTAAVAAAAKAAALLSRGAPLVAELWVATSQLLSGVCPVLTFRVALWLWLTAKTCALVALSPWHFACVALGAAFTVPLLMHSAGSEFQTLNAALQLHLRTRYDATPPGVRWLAACLSGWMGWHMSGRGTRAFAGFLALVKATEWAHAWAERMVARAEQDGGAVKPSSCVLTELPDDSASAKME